MRPRIEPGLGASSRLLYLGPLHFGCVYPGSRYFGHGYLASCIWLPVPRVSAALQHYLATTHDVDLPA
jgi:hypothetical protein